MMANVEVKGEFRLMNSKREKVCRYIVLTIFLLFVIGTFYFLYKDYIAPSRYSPEILEQKDVSGEKVIVKTDQVYKYTIISSREEVTGISIAFDADETDANAKVEILLYDGDYNKITSWIITKEEYINGYTPFLLEGQEIIDDSLVLEIRLKDGSQAAFYSAKDAEDILAYQLLGQASDSLWYLHIFLFIFVLLMIGGVFTGISMKMKEESIFVILVLFLGVIYMVLIPPYFTPDEEYHFAVSYASSSRILDEPVVTEEGNVLVRKTDYDYYLSYIAGGGNELSKKSYKVEVDGILAESDNIMDSQYHIRTLPGKTSLAYIPQILGITFARVFDLNGALLFLAGRFFALLVYTILMFFAIKIIPFAKMLLVVIACLPMTIELAASYNYDAILLPACFLMIAYIFYLAYVKDYVKIKDIIVLAILVSVICIVKYIYAVIFMLGIIIPKEKFGTNRKKIVSAAGVIVAGMIVVFLTNLSSLTGVVGEVGTSVVLWNGEEKVTLDYMFSDPLHTIGVLFRTFQRNADYYVGGAIGRTLGWLDISITPLVFSGYIVALLVSVLTTNRENRIKSIDKIWCFCCCILLTALVYVSLFISWTRVSSNLIEGIQGRYFLPVLFIGFCLFQNQLIVLKKSIKYEIIAGLTVLSVLAIIDIYQRGIMV